MATAREESSGASRPVEHHTPAMTFTLKRDRSGSTPDTKTCILTERMLKALFWLGSSRSDIGNFPADARQRAGYELYLVQSGLEPSDWKPMSSVGAGVQEIRVRTGREHRVFYVAKFDEGIYVLHAFEKKTRKTAKSDLDLARSRLRELLRTRRSATKV
jgi:phage-related protein